MPANKKKDIEEREKALKIEIQRKDWFDTVINEIETKRIIYSDPRLKGYVRDVHEPALKFHIETYLAGDSEKKKAAYAHWEKIKKDGERIRGKRVEDVLKNLESVLKKEDVSLETKKKFIKYAEEEIKTQIPKELQGIYFEMINLYQEGYLKKNE